jgi:hypothetical protein
VVGQQLQIERADAHGADVSSVRIAGPTVSV